MAIFAGCRLLTKTLSFLNIEMMDNRAGICKMRVRIANREDTDQTAQKQSDLGLHWLSSTRPFWQAICVRNFGTSTPVKLTIFSIKSYNKAFSIPRF